MKTKTGYIRQLLQDTFSIRFNFIFIVYAHGSKQTLISECVCYRRFRNIISILIVDMRGIRRSSLVTPHGIHKHRKRERASKRKRVRNLNIDMNHMMNGILSESEFISDCFFFVISNTLKVHFEEILYSNANLFITILRSNTE